jgi:23S rRNA pseudouridine1911/1915/1917 synthase
MATTREDPAAGALVVAANEAGFRLDAFLARRGLLASVSEARRAVAAGVVRVNGRPAKKGVHLEAGDTVDLGEGPATSRVLLPTPELELTVLYQDGDIIAVAKPAGVPTHPLRSDDVASIASALVARFPECATASPDAREGGVGHRLDVATSGVLLAARRREVWHRLREALAAPLCEKIYLAETRGCFPTADHAPADFVLPGPRPGSFVVTAPIGRQGRRGNRVRLASGRRPLPARTEITLLEARASATLVEARLRRGRAHQIRAHLALLGIPVVGDPIYGEPAADGVLRLHAWAISLVHPTTARPLRVEAPLPAWARRRDEPHA